MSDYLVHFAGVFESVAIAMTGVNFQSTQTGWSRPETSLVAVIGVTGGDRGTVQLEFSLDTARVLGEAMNDAPLEEEELLLFIGELANTVCGNAISRLNQVGTSGRHWLTPPVVFLGSDLQVSSPSLQPCFLHYQSDVGDARIRISFEGV